MQLRFRLLVIVALMMLVSSAAFAQVNLTIQYNSSPKEIQTNRSAYSADPDSQAQLTVIATLASTSLPITATTLIVDYPAIITTGRVAGTGNTPAGFNGPNNPIGTNATAGATEDTTPVNLRIVNNSGLFAGASAPVITTVNYSTGQVYILLPFNGGPGAFTTAGFGPTGGGQTGGSFQLANARLDANGLTAPAVATSTLTSSANGYQIVAGSSGNVIDAVSAGIASVSLTSSTVTTPNTAVIYTDRSRPDNVFAVLITEGFASAWWNDGLGDFFDTTNTRDTELRLTFTGIPAGVTITLTGTATNGGVPAFTPSVVTSADNVSVVTWITTQLDRAATTVLTVTGTIGSISSASGCCTTGSISMTASMSPVGSGNIAATTVLPMIPDNTQPIPRFAASEVGPVTVVTITPAKTTMLIPLVMSIPSIKYDTGIAVANTSKDPFGATGGATASSGTLTFYLFPRTTTGAGTSITFTTSATNQVGAGLDSSGVLASGGTFTALASEIWSKAGGTGDFVGYVFVEANFLLGHGVAYISTFRGDFTAGAPVLELQPPAVIARGGAANNLLTY